MKKLFEDFNATMKEKVNSNVIIIQYIYIYIFGPGSAMIEQRSLS